MTLKQVPCCLHCQGSTLGAGVSCSLELLSGTSCLSHALPVPGQPRHGLSCSGMELWSGLWSCTCSRALCRTQFVALKLSWVSFVSFPVSHGGVFPAQLEEGCCGWCLSHSIQEHLALSGFSGGHFKLQSLKASGTSHGSCNRRWKDSRILECDSKWH